ncbi:MAG: STAS/SEC14 domain-containing protein [Thermoleophilia bacterium]
MIEVIPGSSGNVLGYKVSDDVTKDDYAILDPAVEAAVKEHGSVRLLLDLTAFRWEKIDAWASDFAFGRTFKQNIDKMAIVGDRRWERYLAKVAGRFYAKEARFFERDTDGWDWLRR